MPKFMLEMLPTARKALVAVAAIATMNLIAVTAVHGNEATADKLQLQGKLTQGALIIGSTEPGSEVKLNGEKLEVTPAGEFVFGFGRDAQLQHQLQVQLPDGSKIERALELTQREYKVDRVDGVPASTVNPNPEQVKRSRQDSEQVWLARQTFSDRRDFLTPVIRPAEGRISGVYGSQRIFNGEPRRPHFGLDIAAPTGTPVIAPWPGRVLLAVPDMFFSGGTLIIDHGYGVTTTYIHLHQVLVEVGKDVNQGDIIAEIGATGRVTGPHLDWRVNWQQEKLDPALLPYLFDND
ncbi:Murein DD-endopeptidase MepM and murein hydrolase activator NlpD, contain LysM domain [Pseudidiomarina planktonica]|uniref:Murein DD-endopeptidase MepM and murein hydrolase activator NlpD, contain LysM domain n=2 Tax=Pseudidiomarina planktonica TaxID=1323738 RepID=A0A1Y6EXQ3_9GAMM|nr:Murein DD-endopeptidase MepM and murein hydrolase activator NlpD, contain LysM domain [Pseudidiomarina planktonica]